MKQEVTLYLKINNKYYDVLFDACIEQLEDENGFSDWRCVAYEVLQVKDYEHGEILHDNLPDIKSVISLKEKIFEKLQSDIQERKERIGY